MLETIKKPIFYVPAILLVLGGIAYYFWTQSENEKKKVAQPAAGAGAANDKPIQDTPTNQVAGNEPSVTSGTVTVVPSITANPGTQSSMSVKPSVGVPVPTAGYNKQLAY
jgi:hypothetical protein